MKRKHTIITARAAAARAPKAPPRPAIIPSSARRLPGETFRNTLKDPPRPPPPLEPEPVPVESGRRVDLSVDLAPKRPGALVLDVPVLAAAGPYGYGVELMDSVDIEQLGAICTRATTLDARSGNPPPRVAETPAGILNSIGLVNPGVVAVLERYAATWAGWDVPVIVNIAAESVDDAVTITRRLDGQPGIAGIELNLSCPDSANGGLLFGLDATSAARLTRAVRGATDLPLLVKLSPGATDIRRIAAAIAEAGADAISACNTLPGLAIDRQRRRPALGTAYGGLSGPALKPVALRVVFEVAQVVDIPIVAMGGITTLDDVLDYLMAGADAVAVGTAALADPALPVRLIDDLEDWCVEQGLTTHRAIVGAALPARRDRPSIKGTEYRP